MIIYHRHTGPGLPPLHGKRLVVPVLLGPLDVDIGVDPCLGHCCAVADLADADRAPR